MEPKDSKTTSTPPLASTHVETPEAAPLEASKASPVENAGIQYKGDDETRFLLGQKLAYANTLASVCMTWWVSSIVFCGSILAAVWLYRNELINSGMIHLLGVLLSLFFAGIVIFGAQITWNYLPKLGKDLSSLPKKSNGDDFFSTEFSTFKWSMVIGTISFLFILGVWIILWACLASGCWKE